LQPEIFKVRLLLRFSADAAKKKTAKKVKSAMKRLELFRVLEGKTASWRILTLEAMAKDKRTPEKDDKVRLAGRPKNVRQLQRACGIMPRVPGGEAGETNVPGGTANALT
jgi:hypothetical protein